MKPIKAGVPAAIHGQATGARQLWVLWRYWMRREFKTRYAGSVLGLAWAFVQPLASLAIFYVLFGLVLAVRCMASPRAFRWPKTIRPCP